MGRRLFSVFSVSITAPIASRSEASFVQVVARSRNLAFACGEMALFASCRQRNACLRHSLGSPVMTPPTPKQSTPAKQCVLNVRLPDTQAVKNLASRLAIKSRPHVHTKGREVQFPAMSAFPDRLHGITLPRGAAHNDPPAARSQRPRLISRLKYYHEFQPKCPCRLQVL